MSRRLQGLQGEFPSYSTIPGAKNVVFVVISNSTRNGGKSIWTHSKDTLPHFGEVHEGPAALEDLVKIALELCDIKTFCGTETPTVIT